MGGAQAELLFGGGDRTDSLTVLAEGGSSADVKQLRPDVYDWMG